MVLEKGTVRAIERIGVLLLFILSAFLFYTQIYWSHTDIPIHNLFLVGMIEGEVEVRPHLLYYLLLGSITFFTTDLSLVHWASMLLLAFLVVLQFYVFRFYFEKELKLGHSPREHLYLLVLAFVALVIFNYPPGITGNFKLGQIPPNVWHNSTGIFLVPFAVLLFDHSKKLLFDPGGRRGSNEWALLVLFLLNVLIKPVFALPFLGAWAIFSLWQGKAIKSSMRDFFLVLPGVLVLLLQYFYFFESSSSGHGIAIAPFQAWNIHSDHFLLSFLVSVPFPLAFFLLKFDLVRKARDVWYGLTLFGFGMLLYILLIEVDRPEFQNFNKCAVHTNIIFHLVCIARFFEAFFRKKGWELRDLVLLFLLLGQVLSGLVYIGKLPFYGFI
ncbi:MAG: hypothetical protein ABEH38_06005 [Flavobacteriales bacterium]